MIFQRKLGLKINGLFDIMKTIKQFLESHNFLIKGHAKKQYTNPIISKLNLTDKQKEIIETLPEVFFSDKEMNVFNDINGENDALKFFKEDIVCMFMIIAACLVLDNSIKHYEVLGRKVYKHKKYGTHNPYDTPLSTFEYEDEKYGTPLDYIIYWCTKSEKNFEVLKTFCNIYKANKSFLGDPDNVYNLFFEE